MMTVPLVFLSTPSARRATVAIRLHAGSVEISIHALREEGDAELCLQSADTEDFYPRPPRGGRRDAVEAVAQLERISIHALREEGDKSPLAARSTLPKFLSTPSARRATKPRRRERSGQNISIHALREEGDSKNRDKISIFL